MLRSCKEQGERQSMGWIVHCVEVEEDAKLWGGLRG